MSLSGGSWEREGPGGGRDGVIALRTIREIAFSDCARPRQSPVSLSPCGTVWRRRRAATNSGALGLPTPPPDIGYPHSKPHSAPHRHHQKMGMPTVEAKINNIEKARKMWHRQGT